MRTPAAFAFLFLALFASGVSGQGTPVRDVCGRIPVMLRLWRGWLVFRRSLPASPLLPHVMYFCVYINILPRVALATVRKCPTLSSAT